MPNMFPGDKRTMSLKVLCTFISIFSKYSDRLFTEKINEKTQDFLFKKDVKLLPLFFILLYDDPFCDILLCNLNRCLEMGLVAVLGLDHPFTCMGLSATEINKEPGTKNK